MTARHTQTNVTATAVTDADGRFRFPFLKVGPYELVVAKQGFRSVSRPLSLNAGSAFQLPISLTVGGEETVTVTDEAPALETARSQIAGTVSATEAKALPLNGRNFLDLALLVPGVSPTNIPSTQLFAETSAVPGNGLSVASQRNLSNSFIVDGVSANDDAAGLRRNPAGRRVGRAVPGDHVGRAGGAGPRARRLRQRRDPQRRQRPARVGLLVPARRLAERGQPAARADAADAPEPVRR